MTGGGGGSAAALLVATASSPLAGVASPLHAVSRLPHCSAAIWCIVLCYPPHSCPVLPPLVCDVWYLEPQFLKPGESPIEFAERSLNNNMLIGALPDAFQSLTGLINLDLSFNSLSSQLPPSMESLSSLTTLMISYQGQLLLWKIFSSHSFGKINKDIGCFGVNGQTRSNKNIYYSDSTSTLLMWMVWITGACGIKVCLLPLVLVHRQRMARGCGGLRLSSPSSRS
ncbi:hypothetical protein Taro_010597 [Colocasia esculenta]|uniref:Uncharacterized protein n=1 Tax=Colocasia esculenta TaxID=4460 RepID=A0A843U417_COLES|nr:hypothetical protein [Colocasia esculenta]